MKKNKNIKIKIGKEKARFCIYCKTLLTDEKGNALQTAYLTDFGLLCADCIETDNPSRVIYLGK